MWFICLILILRHVHHIPLIWWYILFFYPFYLVYLLILWFHLDSGHSLGNSSFRSLYNPFSFVYMVGYIFLYILVPQLFLNYYVNHEYFSEREKSLLFPWYLERINKQYLQECPWPLSPPRVSAEAFHSISKQSSGRHNDLHKVYVVGLLHILIWYSRYKYIDF